MMVRWFNHKKKFVHDKWLYCTYDFIITIENQIMKQSVCRWTVIVECKTDLVFNSCTFVKKLNINALALKNYHNKKYTAHYLRVLSIKNAKILNVNNVLIVVAYYKLQGLKCVIVVSIGNIDLEQLAKLTISLFYFQNEALYLCTKCSNNGSCIE